MFTETSLDAWHFCRHLVALLKLIDPVRSITQLECVGCFSLLGTEGKSHRSSCVWMEPPLLRPYDVKTENLQVAPELS